MKKIVLSCIVWTIAFMTYAQENFSKSLSGIEWVKIASNADITVKTHEKNELLIKVKGRHHLPEKAKGLKLVGAGGTDNTNLGFSVVQDGSNLIVKNLSKSKGAEIFLPKTQNVSVTNSWNGDIHIEGFQGEVEANANLNGGLTLKNISGPLTAYSLNGALEVAFESMRKEAPIVISTTNGEIDVKLPAKTAADITMSSLNGEIFTNFDLQVPQKNGMRMVAGSKVNGTINGGGTNIKLESVNGNIYLRKK